MCFGKRVDFVCDTYNSPSIKDIERSAHGVREQQFVITGRDQKHPRDFSVALRSSHFKAGFLQFLADDWKRSEFADLIRGHTLYVGVDTRGYKYEVDGDIVTREEVLSLACNHEEADTRLVWHVKHIDETKGACNVVVQTCDTDVLVIFLAHVPSFSIRIWLDIGLSTNNTRIFINATQLGQEIGPEVCAALPGFHAFTGCDYTAAFSRMGKVRTLNLMEKSEEFIDAFKYLGRSSSIPSQVLSTIESFVCQVYTKSQLTSVKKARLEHFQHHFSPKKKSKPLSKIKETDSSQMPPCNSVLMEKIKRANLVAGVWKKAILACPATMDPEENGWVLEGNQYKIHWFEGRQVPENVCTYIADLEEDDDDDIHYSSSSDDSDSD